ncbi:Ig domain-containing protein [Desulfuromonas sp. AOP6]|uniref:Ig domain-containing protein n=1 Tax=Desulfuromonas sp. AOP6 TaxID=1566351 RepID=UPI001287DE22|nr:Ig domain-containing protein [Desulfuromonas sp. AOP6]BCA80227.1 hypothetical protein AOP6_2014 [Desulfuromonas sp. AOP6]
MKYFKVISWNIGCLLFFLLMGGCDSGGTPAVAPETAPQAASQGADTARALATGSESGQMTVRLLPESPTVNDSIEALVQGAAGTLTFTWERNGELLEATGAVLPPHSAAKGDVVGLTVQNMSQEVSAEVTIGNAPPAIIAVPFVNADIFRGVDIELNPEGVDPDGDTITYAYRWYLNGEPLSFQDDPVLPGDQFQRGDIVRAEVVPFDGEDEGRVFEGTELSIPNGPPRIVSDPPGDFAGMRYVYQVEAYDPDDDPFRYELEEGPAGAVIDEETGVLTWDVTGAQEGTWRFRIVVEDEEGRRSSQEYDLNLEFSR